MTTIAGLPVAMPKLRASAAALFTVPASALTVAERAWVSSAMNLGIANAARMPRIVITTTNSMSVNPRALRSIICCSAAHCALLIDRSDALLRQELIALLRIVRVFRRNNRYLPAGCDRSLDDFVIRGAQPCRSCSTWAEKRREP